MDNIELQMKILPIVENCVVIPENEIITCYYGNGSFDLKSAVRDIEKNYGMRLQNMREVYFEEGVTFYTASCPELGEQLEVELVPIEELSDFVSSGVASEVKRTIRRGTKRDKSGLRA